MTLFFDLDDTLFDPLHASRTGLPHVVSHSALTGTACIPAPNGRQCSPS